MDKKKLKGKKTGLPGAAHGENSGYY